MTPEEALKLIQENHERERHVLFGNEAFAISALQVVSGGAVIAILGQINSLQQSSEPILVLLALTALTVSLSLAVIAAFCRHQYKMWDVKAAVSASKGEDCQQKIRHRGSSCYLKAMRRCMELSAVVLVLALAALIAGLWIEFLNRL